MKPIVTQDNGRTLANAEAVAQFLDVATETWRGFVASGRPKSNPPPQAVRRDPDTGVMMWDMADVEEWRKRRRGHGWWRASTVPDPPRQRAPVDTLTNSTGYIPAGGV